MLTQTVSVHNILSYCTVFSLGFYFTIVFLQAGYTGFVLFRDMCELVMTSLVKAMRCQRNRNVSQYMYSGKYTVGRKIKSVDSYDCGLHNPWSQKHKLYSYLFFLLIFSSFRKIANGLHGITLDFSAFILFLNSYNYWTTKTTHF